MSNVVYYRMYSRIIPISSFGQLSHLGVMMSSVVELLQWIDYFFIVPTLLLILFYYIFLERKMVVHTFSLRLKTLGVLFFSFFSITSLDFARSYHYHGNFFNGLINVSKTDPMIAAGKYGLVVAYLSQAYQDMQVMELSDAEKSKINSWLKQHQQNTVASTYAKPTNKNIILIVVESLESWVINHKIEGKPVTPNINQLLANHTSLYAPYVVPQVREGRSSDAQLIIQTGLLPIAQGAVCMKFDNNKYPSLAYALKDKKYHSYTFMGNLANFWNQKQMTKAMGFDGLASIQDYEIDEYIEYGLSDATFFRQSIAKIKNLPKPYFAQMITLTSHHPYSNIPKEKLKLSVPEDCDKMLANYMKAINYTDDAIGVFINQLKESGEFDKSIIIITGDHEAFPIQDYKKYSEEKYVKGAIKTDFFVPLIVVNAPEQAKYEGIMGQIDIYPTLLDLLGIQQYSWKGMGQSIFSANKRNYAFDSYKYNIIGDTTNIPKEEITHQKTAWEISDLMIKGNFFKQKN